MDFNYDTILKLDLNWKLIDQIIKPWRITKWKIRSANYHPFPEGFSIFFFSMKQRCCFSTTIWLFCINFDHVPEKFNLHFASLVTKIGADWHGINNSLSKTTEDGDSRQNSQPTIQAVQQTWNKADFLRNCKDENEEPADLGCLIVVSGTCQPSLHQQPEMCEILYKRCRWFDEDPQPADVSSSTSPHQRNRSRTSPNNSSK